MAVAGFAMIGIFMALVMSRKVTPMVAFIVVPLTFAVVMGHGSEVGGYIVGSLEDLAPVVALLTFAILYFSIMIDAGLFNPLIRKVLSVTGEDPLRILLGTAILALVVSLDGDGTSTILIVVGAFLPLYKRLGIRVIHLVCVLALAIMSTNLTPWGGPVTRVAVALNLDPQEVFISMIPVMLVMAACTVAVAFVLGVRERRRLEWSASGRRHTAPTGGPGTPAAADLADGVDPAHLLANEQTMRPRLIWFNGALTIALLVALVTELTVAPVLFMAAFAIALLVNYPRPSQQKERLEAHAPTLLAVITMILTAGVLTGVLNGTGMIEAMANSLVDIIPSSLDGHFGPVMALVALPAQFFLSSDAYYFGVVPVLSEVGVQHGLTPLETASAALLAGPVHALSPLVPAALLLAGLAGLEIGEILRKNLKWAVAVSFVSIAAVFAFGVVPL
ncbi:CitMHS family transporter [Rhodococcus pyridinivorans]